MTTKIFLMTVALVLGVSTAANAADCTVTNINDAGAGSLRQCLADVSNNGTVTVSPALSGQTIVLTSGVNDDGQSAFKINKNFTLNGNGIILSGNNERRHFIVHSDNANYNQTFNNVHFTNGNSIYGGSIEYVCKGTLTLNNCIFSNNVSATTNDDGGGALHINVGAKLICTSCIFINNTSNKHGGAIDFCSVSRGSSIKNCIFLGNRSTRSEADGHSIYCKNGSAASGGSNTFDYPARGSCFTFNGANESPVSPGTDIFTWNIGKPNAPDVTASYSFAQKTLTITGTGEMKDFHQDSVPWKMVSAITYIAVIRGGVSNIGNNAFKNCYSLRQVRLPNSDVGSIGVNVFMGCNLLTHIFLMRGTPPALDATAFNGLTKSNIGVFVPVPSAYMSDAAWSGFGITSAY